jgi:pimeloyl-ACP methyl ester carboxylesterase
MDFLSPKYHVIAVNLFGYGNTDTWKGLSPQTLKDHVDLIHPLLPDDGAKVSIVGHSFGGSVAMKAAASFQNRVHRLVLIEPNPFYLLELLGYNKAYQEAVDLRICIKLNGKQNLWHAAAAVFADYWSGVGSWNSMPSDRQNKFAEALKPNFHEWDCVMNETTPISDWAHLLPGNTTVVSSRDTTLSISMIVAAMRQYCKDWRFETIDSGGHMAVMTKPDQVNPVIEKALL